MIDIKIAADISDRLAAWSMLEDASTVLEKCLTKYPGNPELMRRLGRIKLAQGHPREAANLLEGALAHYRMMEATFGTSGYRTSR